MKFNLKSLCTWPVLTVLVVILTRPLWAMPLTYLFLKSIDLTSTTLIPISTCVALGSVILGSVLMTLRHLRSVRKEPYGGPHRQVVNPAKSWSFSLHFVAMYLLLPPSVALRVWSDLSHENTERMADNRDGTLSQSESLKKVLRNIEARGVFTVMDAP